MRRRFLNSGGAVEPPMAATFVARDVTDLVIASMTDSSIVQPIGIVIMWDRDNEWFKAFAFSDDFLPSIYVNNSYVEEFFVEQYLPVGILLYGRRQAEDLGTDPTEITCVSLLMPSSSGEAYNLITPALARAAGRQFLQTSPFHSGTSYILNKIDTTENYSQTIPLSHNYLDSFAPDNILSGYNIFHETDYFFMYGDDRVGSDVEFSIRDEFNNFIVGGNIINQDIQSYQVAKSPFVSSYSSFESYYCPYINEEPDMYSGETGAYIDFAFDMPQCRLQDRTQPAGYLRKIVSGWYNTFNGLGRIQLPTILELRMLFARLGLITFIQDTLMAQELITTRFIDLLFLGSSPAFGSVFFGATMTNSTSTYHIGIQGLSGRLFTLLPSYPSKCDAFCIPFFSLSVDDF